MLPFLNPKIKNFGIILKFLIYTSPELFSYSKKKKYFSHPIKNE